LDWSCLLNFKRAASNTMKIETEQIGKNVVLHVAGRLDATWAEHFHNAVRNVLRAGQHHVRIEASKLEYLSSAGIRVLLLSQRELATVNGSFFIFHPSEFVESTLRMSGLEAFLAANAGIQSADEAPTATGGVAPTDVYTLASSGGMVLRLPARWTPWARVQEGDLKRLPLPPSLLALGIGAAGNDLQEVRNQLGEFLAVAGCMCWQPADMHHHPPDYVIQTGDYVPEIHALQALVAEGAFSALFRFQSAHAGDSLPLTELAERALRVCGTDAVAMVALAEIDGLVGTALARSPGLVEAGSQPGQFPEIRDWMNFCGDRVHAGLSALLVCFVARPSAVGPLTPFLPPLPSNPNVALHAHAAIFPFRPLPDGQISLDEHVRALMDANEPIDLLHLVEDDRPLTGLGQSTFIRGACWCAPLRWEEGGTP